jgi:hypothetical protein
MRRTLLILALAACSGGGSGDGTGPNPTHPAISLASSAAAFSGTEHGANPGPQTIAVTNGGDGDLIGLTASTTYSAGQPSGWLTAGLNKGTAPAALTLQPATGILGPGIYGATVSVASSESGVTQKTILVTFAVTAHIIPRYTISGTLADTVTFAPMGGASLTFNGVLVTISPGAQSFSSAVDSGSPVSIALTALGHAPLHMTQSFSANQSITLIPLRISPAVTAWSTNGYHVGLYLRDLQGYTDISFTDSTVAFNYITDNNGVSTASLWTLTPQSAASDVIAIYTANTPAFDSLRVRIADHEGNLGYFVCLLDNHCYETIPF